MARHFRIFATAALRFMCSNKAVPLMNVSAPAAAHCRRLKMNSPVHRDAIFDPSFSRHAAACWIFGGFRDEALPAKSGIDRHDQKRIDLVQIRLDTGHGGRRIDGQPNLFAQRAYFPNQRRHLAVQFDMNVDPVRPRLGERFQKNFRPRTHQVNVKY